MLTTCQELRWCNLKFKIFFYYYYLFCMRLYLQIWSSVKSCSFHSHTNKKDHTFFKRLQFNSLWDFPNIFAMFKISFNWILIMNVLLNLFLYILLKMLRSPFRSASWSKGKALTLISCYFFNANLLVSSPIICLPSQFNR